MSLLMDALKRAESNKQQALRGSPAQAASDPTDALSLEPIAAEENGTTANPLPDLADFHEAVDADLVRSARSPAASNVNPAPPVSKPLSDDLHARDAVRNAFAAKQNVAPASRLPLWLALGTLFIAGIAIAGYVWFQLHAMNGGGSLTARQYNQPLPPPAPTPRPLPAQPKAAVAASDFGEISGSTVATPGVRETPLFTPRQERSTARKPVSQDEVPANRLAIHLTRTSPEPDKQLLRAYASLQRGNLQPARLDYEQVLKRDPNNTDAVLALAAIAQMQNRPGDAEALRQRAWVADPSDPTVQSAMLSGSAANADPQGTEIRLKTLLSAQPESAPLNFALGNLMSRQNRWSEAQQAYFNAVAADGDNPDFLFNLAISLDHLHQPRLAVQHYRLALEAATRRPAAFDRRMVEKRLDELRAGTAR